MREREENERRNVELELPPSELLLPSLPKMQGRFPATSFAESS